MKFTLSWLREHLETTATAAEIAEALTDLGLEVEDLHDPAASLAAFTVGEVLEAGPHPDADRLRLCRVATASGERQIVCGAPNARAGIKVVVAQPGDYVPGIDLTLKVGRIRGVESHGMMLSEREMQLSDEHEGILELDPSAPVGARFVDVHPFDPVFHIAVTPNRPDALAVAGIARDLAARGMGRVITPEIEPVHGSYPCPVGIYLAPDVAHEACPLFAGRLIRGVRNGPSPAWLQARLKAIGLRPISALVDVTNLVTYDRARPLHVFDAAQAARCDLRPPRQARREPRRPRRQDLPLRRHRDPGLRREGRGSHRRRHGRPQDRRHRGDDRRLHRIRLVRPGPHRPHRPPAQDQLRRPLPLRARRRPALRRPGLELATRLILELCGGEPSEIVVAGAPLPFKRTVTLRPERVARLVGLDIAPEEQARILTASASPSKAIRSRHPPGAPTSRARPTSSRRSPASPRSPASRAARSPAPPASPARSSPPPRSAPPPPAARSPPSASTSASPTPSSTTARRSSSAAAPRRSAWKTRSARR
jgi:phenylalanyl-tRNA synthetase beta chain